MPHLVVLKSGWIEMAIKLYIAGECPICPGSGELVVLENKKTKSLLFYCAACCSAWHKFPTQAPASSKDINVLHEIAPDGVVEASLERINLEGIKIIAVDEYYENLQDLLD